MAVVAAHPFDQSRRLEISASFPNAAVRTMLANRTGFVACQHSVIGIAWAPDVNDPAGRDLLADVAAIRLGWDRIVSRMDRQPSAADDRSAVGIDFIVFVALARTGVVSP